MGMTGKDFVSDVKETVGIAPVAISSSTTTNGAIVDTAGYRTLTFILCGGVRTDGTYTPLINESDDSGMSGETAVADADLLPAGTGQEATAAIATSGAITKIGYRGSKRYVTCDIVSTGVTTGVAGFTVIVLQTDPVNLPIA